MDIISDECIAASDSCTPSSSPSRMEKSEGETLKAASDVGEAQDGCIDTADKLSSSDGDDVLIIDESLEQADQVFATYTFTFLFKFHVFTYVMLTYIAFIFLREMRKIFLMQIGTYRGHMK